MTSADELLARGKPGADCPLILFDGECNFCSRAVNFVLAHERDQSIRFAPSQSPAGRAALAEHGIAGSPGGIVLIEGGRLYRRAVASLRLCSHLCPPWRWLGALAVIPLPILDGIYGWIAANRYRFGGKSVLCRTLAPELRSRFLG